MERWTRSILNVEAKNTIDKPYDIVIQRFAIKDAIKDRLHVCTIYHLYMENMLSLYVCVMWLPMQHSSNYYCMYNTLALNALEEKLLFVKK